MSEDPADLETALLLGALGLDAPEPRPAPARTEPQAQSSDTKAAKKSAAVQQIRSGDESPDREDESPALDCEAPSSDESGSEAGSDTEEAGSEIDGEDESVVKKNAKSIAAARRTPAPLPPCRKRVQTCSVLLMIIGTAIMIGGGVMIIVLKMKNVSPSGPDGTLPPRAEDAATGSLGSLETDPSLFLSGVVRHGPTVGVVGDPRTDPGGPLTADETGAVDTRTALEKAAARLDSAKTILGEGAKNLLQRPKDVTVEAHGFRAGNAAIDIVALMDQAAAESASGAAATGTTSAGEGTTATSTPPPTAVDIDAWKSIHAETSALWASVQACIEDKVKTIKRVLAEVKQWKNDHDNTQRLHKRIWHAKDAVTFVRKFADIFNGAISDKTRTDWVKEKREAVMKGVSVPLMLAEREVAIYQKNMPGFF